MLRVCPHFLLSLSLTGEQGLHTLLTVHKEREREGERERGQQRERWMEVAREKEKEREKKR